jgi:PPOX class probable FMN-dependent enzyme
MPFADAVTSEVGLREIYAEASKTSLAKEIDHLDDNCRQWIAHSTFVVLATSDTDGRCDVSPKGGPAGFVRVLDDHRLAIPDFAGNNRLDSIRNIVASSTVALLFCIPGIDETMRINGRATITTEPAVLEACVVRDITPKVAIGVDVVTAFIHCAKALRRASLWAPDEWPDVSDLPKVACILRDHYALPDMDVDAVERRLAESYATTMWQPGGRPTQPASTS